MTWLNEKKSEIRLELLRLTWFDLISRRKKCLRRSNERFLSRKKGGFPYLSALLRFFCFGGLVSSFPPNGYHSLEDKIYHYFFYQDSISFKIYLHISSKNIFYENDIFTINGGVSFPSFFQFDKYSKLRFNLFFQRFYPHIYHSCIFPPLAFFRCGIVGG